MSKCKDVVKVVDGVKVTVCAYRGPRKSEVTFPIDKSRYTTWALTVSKARNGSRGTLISG